MGSGTVLTVELNQLNEKQRRPLDKVLREVAASGRNESTSQGMLGWGTTGVEKLFLLCALSKLLEKIIRRAASTDMRAFRIAWLKLHSLFELPVGNEKPLQGQTPQIFQRRLVSV